MADAPNATTSEQQEPMESTSNDIDESESEEEMSAEELRDAILDVYKGRIKGEAVESKYTLTSSTLVREAIARLLHIQSSRVLNLRPPLEETSEKRQIYRWATRYANAKMPMRPYTHIELKEAVFRRITNSSFYPTLTAQYVFPPPYKNVHKRSIRVTIRMKDASSSYENLQNEYGVPMRSLRRFVSKVFTNFGVGSLKELKKQKIEHSRIKEMIEHTNINSLGRPTFLTEEEEAMYVAAAEKEKNNGEPIANDCVSRRLLECLQNVRAEKNASEAKYKSQLRYARLLINKVNAREGKNSNEGAATSSLSANNLKQEDSDSNDEDEDEMDEIKVPALPPVPITTQTSDEEDYIMHETTATTTATASSTTNEQERLNYNNNGRGLDGSLHAALNQQQHHHQDTSFETYLRQPFYTEKM